MIIDQPQTHFIFGYHPQIYEGYSYIAYKKKPLTNQGYLDYWGKWILFGPRNKLDKIGKSLDPHVDSGIIPCFKYDRKPLVNLGMEECVMSIYCDVRDREQVWEKIAGTGERLKAWIFDRETVQMWLPGGRLLEQWIRSEKISQEEAEEVREDSRQRFSKIFDFPDRTFEGWPQ